jgi:hypothetical protein
MKKNQKTHKKYRILLWISLSVLLTSAGAYGIYRGIYEYTYYRNYKSLQNIKLLYVYPWEHDRCEMDLPVKFAPESHNAGVVQKLLVTAENRKSFMIFLYEDNHIQLLSMPIKKYPLIGIVTTYYDLTDAKSKEKLRKLLDAHRKSDE